MSATVTASPGDRFSRGIKQNSTEGHKDSTRPFIPLQERDEPCEIPGIKVKGRVKGDLSAYGAVTSACRNKSVHLSGFLLLESSGSAGVRTSPKGTVSD